MNYFSYSKGGYIEKDIQLQTKNDLSQVQVAIPHHYGLTQGST